MPEEDCLLESLRWIVEFLDICPEEVLPFTPKILAHMLPAMASTNEIIYQAATRVNNCLMDYVASLSDDPGTKAPGGAQGQVDSTQSTSRLPIPGERTEGPNSNRASLASSRDLEAHSPTPANQQSRSMSTPTGINIEQQQADLDYGAAVSSLTLLFLNDHETTRVAAMTWLIMLQRKAPRKVLAQGDGLFTVLLKTLSDPCDQVVTKDLQLMSQISRTSDDQYFVNFMINLLSLFSTDRKLLESRGNLIIRQLSLNLSPERIYRTMAECLEREDDLEFASIMVQNLNNNLITAPQLSDMRKRLRNLDSKVSEIMQLFAQAWLTLDQDGQTLFVNLFKAWCHNAVATFSLCLLAQAYEQAYHLLQILYENCEQSTRVLLTLTVASSI